MEEIAHNDPVARKRREGVETFLSTLVKGSRTIILYKPGHSIIGQVVERVLGLLRTAVGEEPNIQLDIKAKQILAGDEPLADLPELTSFAIAMHNLGIGQVLLTARVGAEGLEQFMRILTWKADEKRTLSDLQKTVTETRIDGLQLITLLNFVVTGEQEEDTQKPGELSEAELCALEGMLTLPDFLHLLLRQNERLSSREAEQLTALFDTALDGSLPWEDFEAQMPWNLYHGRVRACWDRMRADISGREKWTRGTLISDLSLSSKADIAARADHHTHDAEASAAHSLATAHTLLDKPVGERQPRFAQQVYRRLLEDMSRAGRLEHLLGEFRIWKAKAADPRWGAYLATLHPELERLLPTAPVAAEVARRLAEKGGDMAAVDELREFAFSIGPEVMPLLVDELRRVTDKDAQKGLCAFLSQLARRLGAGAVAAALNDEDYFIVLQAAAVLEEIAYPDLTAKAVLLLGHGHPKVRGTAVRILGRVGGLKGAIALGTFISSGTHPEEAKLAATTLSHMQDVAADKLLLNAYRTNEDYDTRLALATALGRQPTPEVEAFLVTITKQSFREWVKGLIGRFSGAPKDLREAALHSLELVRQELHGKKG